jgi:hypothetical protein
MEGRESLKKKAVERYFPAWVDDILLRKLEQIIATPKASIDKKETNDGHLD